MNVLIKGEKSFFGKWLSLFLLLLLLFHFAFSLNYNLTDFEKRSSFQNFYFEPLFKQNFKIFAPDVPAESNQLYLKYYTEKLGWSAWVNPGLKLYKQLSLNRFSKEHYSFLIYKLAIHDLQYADIAITYYEKKNSVSNNELVAFKNHYLNTASALKLTRKYLSKEIKELAGEQQVVKVKCCIFTTQFTAPQPQSKSLEKAQLKFAFFDFDSI